MIKHLQIINAKQTAGLLYSVVLRYGWVKITKAAMSSLIKGN